MLPLLCGVVLGASVAGGIGYWRFRLLGLDFLALSNHVAKLYIQMDERDSMIACLKASWEEKDEALHAFMPESQAWVPKPVIDLSTLRVSRTKH